MGIREGLLVLLAGGANHGYQLKLDFEQATVDAWPLNVGQVYSTLQRLERDGFVAETTTDEEGRVSYALTEAGTREYRSWMTAPEQRPVPHRDEVAMKVLLATVPNAVDATEVIEEQRRATMANLQEYSRLRNGIEPDSADLALLLQLDRLILLRQVELRWLDDVEERLASIERKPKTATQSAANDTKAKEST